jgi:hypothetical protein
MKRLSTILALAVMLAIGLAGEAKAVLTFSAAEMDLFTVQSSTPGYEISDLGANLPANAVTAAPAYSDGLTPMSGDAGATGRWPTGGFNDDVTLRLGSAFAPTDYSGFDALHVIAYNDNGDAWGHSLWIETTANGVVSSTPVIISADGSADLSLDISGLDLSSVIGWGVGINANLDGSPSPGDTFHSSWRSTPEPSMMIVFGSLIGICCGVGIRRRQR